MINSWLSNKDIVKPDVADTSYDTLLRETYALRKKNKDSFSGNEASFHVLICEERISLYCFHVLYTVCIITKYYNMPECHCLIEFFQIQNKQEAEAPLRSLHPSATVHPAPENHPPPCA